MIEPSQKSLEADEKKEDEEWKLAEFPKDESFITLGIGEELIGTLVAKKTNFYGNPYYIFEKENGEIVKLSGTTNLDRWLEQFEPGDKMKIVHVEDRKSPQPGRKPLQIYEVYVPR